MGAPIDYGLGLIDRGPLIVIMLVVVWFRIVCEWQCWCDIPIAFPYASLCWISRRGVPTVSDLIAAMAAIELLELYKRNAKKKVVSRH